jgi:hypothetical protein
VGTKVTVQASVAFDEMPKKNFASCILKKRILENKV